MTCDPHASARSSARRHPPLLRVRTRVLERGADEQVRAERHQRSLRVHADAGARAPPQLLEMGRGVRAVGQLLLIRPGPVVPESPLHDRRAVGRRTTTPSRTRRERRSSRRRPASRSRGGATPSRRSTSRWSTAGAGGAGAAVLRLPDRGRPPRRGGHPVGLLRRVERSAWLRVVGVLRDRARADEPGDLAAPHLPGGQLRCRRRRRASRSGHVGHTALRAERAP